MQSKTDSDMTGKTSIMDSKKKHAAFRTISEESENGQIVVRSQYSINTRNMLGDDDDD